MRRATLLLLAFLSALLVPACAGLASGGASGRALGPWRAAAESHGVVLEIPRFEATPARISGSVRAAKNRAGLALDHIADQDPESITFESTFAALDDALYPVFNAANRLWLMKETHPDDQVREAATAAVDDLNEWFVGVQYREDVYRACKAFADTYDRGEGRRLQGEELKLFRDTMRDYRRAGLHLDPATRLEVEELQNRLNGLATKFDTTITNAAVTIHFTAEDLEGVPGSFLEQSRTEEGRHAVRPTVITDYLAVMQNAVKEATRARLAAARYAVAMEENGPVLNEMLAVREKIAGLLGYGCWADYQIEPKMAKETSRALDFVEDLAAGLEPKFQAELEEFRKMKVQETGDPEARIHIWDFRYYMTKLQKERYQVDAEALRVFFPLDRVIEGMFAVYAESFGLSFAELSPPWVWAEGVRLFVASDAATGEPLGLFYFDLFPREGKYNHFAQFDVTWGRLEADGRYRRPVAALVCNFTPPAADRPSLLSHSEVETLFHEFGHCLHNILTRARFATFAGTNVPRDFVEAPSQVLENWVWDPRVLDRFAADYRDPSRKIDPGILDRLKEADLATKGTFYRRQLCFALADLRMHLPGADKDGIAIANRAMEEIFLPPPEGTGFAAYWGHLTGYDAGYYGYAWADSIAADLATVFEHSIGGFMDPGAGMRLRTEIYEVGGSREAEESIRSFLGRERSNAAFLRSLGIGEREPAAK